MEINEKVIEHVANLARLNLSAQEKEMLTHQMRDIIHYVDKLSELDTENIEPTAHVLPLVNVLREDEVKPSFERDKILSNAPTKQNGCFKVPKVVE